MTEINETAAKVADLSFTEQATLILIALLASVTDGKENMARVGNVVNDLFQLLPWRVDPDDVDSVLREVATYGVVKLPGHEMPVGGE